MNKLNTVYFLGIGGIGMSALARYFKSKGVNVSGYDKTRTPLTDQLIKEGISIHFEEDISFVPSTVDLVVYTPAIPASHKEFQYVIHQQYPLSKRSEVLGLIAKEKFTIAVAGTHGKTTISSMVAHILKYANKNMTAFIGGVMKNYQTNYVVSDVAGLPIIVVEADEYDRSFLTLFPDIAVISAMDADHLDIYGKKEALLESFALFIQQVKSGGSLIIKKSIASSISTTHPCFTYSVTDEATCFGKNIAVVDGKYCLDIYWKSKLMLKSVKIGVPALHNVENALAAAAVAFVMDIDPKTIGEALESYTGVARRFDVRLNSPSIVYIDDYAHHPEEIKTCIQSVRKLYPDRRITGIFQPHLYTRTRDFADEFAKSLELLDEVILLEIYPAREKPIKNIDANMLLEKIHIQAKAICDKDSIIDELKKRNLDVMLTLGAGDIDQQVLSIEEYLKTRYINLKN